MSWDIELAEEFKKRNNKKWLGALVGKIVQLEPLKISILKGQVVVDNVYILKNNNLTHTREMTVTEVKVNNAVMNNAAIDSYSHRITGDMTAENIKGNITIKESLKVGMEVLVIASTDNQTFFVIGEVTRQVK